MKKRAWFLFAISLMLICSSCSGKASEGSASANNDDQNQAADNPSIEVVSTISPTTGKEVSDFQPIVVMVENSEGARPQTGLNEADIVYEALAEGSITRFAAVFNDNIPEVVGPVRSTRLYYINIAREWDAALVHYGGPSTASRPSYVYGEDSNDIKIRIDGIKSTWNSYFWRSEERNRNVHSVYTDLTKIKKLCDYTPSDHSTLNFKEGETLSEEVTHITVSFTTQNAATVEFKYDNAQDKYIRYQSGSEFEMRTVTKDVNGNEKTETKPMASTNLIIQYAKTYVLENDVEGRRMVETTGTGKCEFFIGGTHSSGTWERQDNSSDTIYKLDDGTELNLRPGNTWICLVPSSQKVSYK